MSTMQNFARSLADAILNNDEEAAKRYFDAILNLRKQELESFSSLKTIKKLDDAGWETMKAIKELSEKYDLFNAEKSWKK